MKATFSTLTLVLSLNTGLVTLTSVPAQAADAAVVASKSDAEITAAVEAALATEPALKGQKITVTTKGEKDKEVTLAGTVT